MYEKARAPSTCSKAHLGTSPIQGTYPQRTRHHPELNDCRLVCQDGTVYANTYAMVQASTVLSDLFDEMPDTDTEETGDDTAAETGMRVFFVKHICKATMEHVVGLIQRTLCPTDLKEISDLRAVLVAMDYLGCSTRWKKLVDRLWILIRSCPVDESKMHMIENASLIIPEYPDAFFHKFRLMCPNWIEYKKLFDEISMTPMLAVVVMTQLMTFFPMPVLIHAIVTNTPRKHVYNVISGIFKIPRIGSYFHPDELMLAFDVVLQSATHDIDTSIIRAVLESTQGVNTPTPTPRIGASMVTFHTKNMASFSFVLDRPLHRTKTVAFSSNTASFTFDPQSSMVETKLKLHKFGETGAAVDCVYIRTTVYPRDTELDDGHMSKQVAWDKVYDRWTTVRFVDHEQDGDVTCREPLTTSATADHGHIVHAARIDVYWVHDPRRI